MRRRNNLRLVKKSRFARSKKKCSDTFEVFNLHGQQKIDIFLYGIPKILGDSGIDFDGVFNCFGSHQWGRILDLS